MCESKADGGKRCKSELHARTGTTLVAREARRRAGISEAQARRLITKVKTTEARRLGVRPTADTASQEDLAAFVAQQKGKTMEDNTLRLSKRYRTADRWDHVAKGVIPRALLAAWQRVLSWARSGSLALLGGTVLVAGLLTACTAAEEPVTPPPATQTQEVEQEEPTTDPTTEPEEVVSTDLDLATVELPDEVVDLWGEESARAGVEQAHDFRTLADGLVDLHGARDGSTPETAYFEPLREHMTADAYEGLIGAVEQGEWHDVTALLPVVGADGSVDGGITYVSEDDLRLIPTYDAVSVGTEARDGQNILTVTTYSELFIKNNSDASHDYVIERTQTLGLIPDGDGWVVDGWSGDSSSREVPRG